MMITARRERKKRQYVRIRLPNQFGLLRIVQIHNYELNTSERKVMILDISAGGACFSTDLKLPVTNKVLIELHVELMGMSLDLKGNVVWRRSADNLYQYGMKFILTPEMRIFLIRFLDKLILRLNPSNERIHRIYHYFSARYEQDCLPVMNKK